MIIFSLEKEGNKTVQEAVEYGADYYITSINMAGIPHVLKEKQAVVSHSLRIDLSLISEDLAKKLAALLIEGEPVLSIHSSLSEEPICILWVRLVE